MIYFFLIQPKTVFTVQVKGNLSSEDTSRLNWLFGGSQLSEETTLTGTFIGPRAAMVTPWSTNAVEITQNMGIQGIIRIEEFHREEADFSAFDPMLSQKYKELNQEIFTINIQPEPILEISDIAAYNQQEGLPLSDEEIEYQNNLSERIGRILTDSEVYGFSQVKSDHSRHKIFNGTFVMDVDE